MTMSKAANPSSAQAKNVKAKTKRQRRKDGPNPANTWQQQPTIKSASARERAYLVDAGLYMSKSTKKSGGDEVLDPSLDINSPEVKFGRLLGGTDQRSRHRAVAKLKAYLRARCDIRNESGGVSELDMMKLWKAMWYTLYMADKVPVQEELSKRLAQLIWCFAGTEEEDEYAGQVYLNMDEGLDDGESGDEEGTDEDDDEDEDGDDEDYEVSMKVIENTLNASSDDESISDDVSDSDEQDGNKDEGQDDDSEEIDDSLLKHCRGAHLSALYVRTFFRTMRREWGNVDKHRIDKFYTAVRLVIAEVYKYMSKRHWNLGIIRLFNDTIFEEVLTKVPNGLRYHVIDLAVGELAKANRDASLPLTEATFLDCLEPYFALSQKVDDKIVQGRVMANVLNKFLEEYSVVSKNADDSEEGGGDSAELVFREVHVGSVAKFIFEVASAEDTEDRYRAELYEMHKKYKRMIMATGKDVDLQNVEEDEEDAAMLGDIEEDEEASDDEVSDEDSDKLVANLTEPVLENGEEEAPQSKKKKKRKKKGDKSTKKAGGEEEELETEEVVKIAKKKKKKGEKSTKKAAGDAEELETEEIVSSSKTKKKKNEKSAKTADEEAEELETEQVVNISIKEQKKATSASGKRREMSMAAKEERIERKRAKKRRASEESVDGDRRVSFGAVNHTKSHKASMRDLRKRPIPKAAMSPAPDKSILREQKHGGSQSAEQKKNNRTAASGRKARNGPSTERRRKKRAVDYF